MQPRCEKHWLQILISLSTKKAQPEEASFIFDLIRLIRHQLIANVGLPIGRLVAAGVAEPTFAAITGIKVRDDIEVGLYHRDKD